MKRAVTTADRTVDTGTTFDKPVHSWRDIPGWFQWRRHQEEAAAHFPNGSRFVEVWCYVGREADTNLAELSAFVQGGRDAILDEAIERAVARGELEPGQVSERVARVPVDLFRYELMMTLKPVSDRVIEEIVDDVFLPLVRLGAAGSP
jgi:hypothetical protein